jgi:hypothetical protein
MQADGSYMRNANLEEGGAMNSQRWLIDRAVGLAS